MGVCGLHVGVDKTRASQGGSLPRLCYGAAGPVAIMEGPICVRGCLLSFEAQRHTDSGGCAEVLGVVFLSGFGYVT